jgi:hypothetical protein
MTPLSSLKVAPGQRQFLAEINLTQKKGFGRFNASCLLEKKIQNSGRKRALVSAHQ